MKYSEKELKSFSLKELSEPESLNSEARLMEQMNHGKLDSFSAVKKFIKKNGSKIFAKTRITAISQDQGKTDYQVAIIEDISKELEADRKLKASENRLAALISNLQTGVLLEDEDRKIALTNQMFCDLFQIPATPDQLKGTDCSTSAKQSKIYFKNPEKFLNRIEEILAERKIVLSDELEMIDGRVLERDFIPINNDGDYKGHLWAYHDVTISKNYRKKLEAQREKYSSIIANSIIFCNC